MDTPVSLRWIVVGFLAIIVAGMLWSQPTPILKEKTSTAEITKPLEVSAINQVRYANYYADSGDGTSGTPWADWCDALTTGTQIVFPAGYYLADQTCTLDSDEWIDCAEQARFERHSDANALPLFATAAIESNIRISGCTFDNNALAVSQEDIEIDAGSSYIYITDNTWVGLDSNRTGDLTIVENAGAGSHSRYIWHLRNRIIADTPPSVGQVDGFEVATASDVFFLDNYVYGWGGFKAEQSKLSTTRMSNIVAERNQFVDVDSTHIIIRTHNANTIENVSCSFNTASKTSSFTHVKGLCEVGSIVNIGGTQGTFCSDGTTNCTADADCTGIGDEDCRIGIQKNVRMIGNSATGHDGPMFKLCDAGQTCKADGFVIADNACDGRNIDDGLVDAASTSLCIRVGGRLADSDDSSDGTITGNYSQYTAGSGIEVTNCNTTTIAGNTLSYAVQIDEPSDDPDDKGAITAYIGSDDILIANNTVENVGNATVGATYTLYGINVRDQQGGGGIEVRGNKIIDNRGTTEMDYGVRFGGAGASIVDSAIVGNRVIGANSGDISTQGTIELFRGLNYEDDSDTLTELNKSLQFTDDSHIDVGSADCSSGAPIECYVYAQEGMGIGAVPAAAGQLVIRAPAGAASTLDFDYDPGVTGPVGGTGLVLSVGADDQLKLLKGGATSQTIAKFDAQALTLGRDDTSQSIDLIFSGSNEKIRWDTSDARFEISDPVWFGTTPSVALADGCTEISSGVLTSTGLPCAPTGTPMGELSFTGNSTATTISTSSTWTIVAPGVWSLTMNEQFSESAEGYLTYTGSSTNDGHLGCTLSIASAGANDDIQAILVKNATVNGSGEYSTGTLLTAGTISFQNRGASVANSSAIHVMTSLSTNDTVSLFIKNNTDTDDLTITDANLFALIPIGAQGPTGPTGSPGAVGVTGSVQLNNGSGTFTNQSGLYYDSAGDANTQAGLRSPTALLRDITSGVQDLMVGFDGSAYTREPIEHQYTAASGVYQIYTFKTLDVNFGRGSGKTMNVGRNTATRADNNATLYIYGDFQAGGKITGGGSADVAGSFDGGVKYIPRSAVPITCNSSNIGFVYYDSDNDTVCICREESGPVYNWREIGDLSTACS